MVLSWARWLDERIGPQDPERRERYNRARGVIGIGLIAVMGLRWLIAHW